MSDGEGAATPSREERLERALAEYYASLDEGRRPDRDALVARYPDLREELEKIFENEGFVASIEGTFRRAGGAEPVLPLASGGRLGDYEILEEIAHGGMGVVYRARQRSLGRTVALKVVLTGEFASEEERRRFRREAEMAAALDHPNIVSVYEVGESGRLCYLAMQLIEGKSLGELELGAEDRFRFAATVVGKVARTMDYAHRRGIIHRDLKPANILMDERGEPHVVDFGLARLANHSGTLTRTGMVLGTLRYMAPEQAGGEATDTDVTVDVYGLGAILYQLLAGVPPFRASSSVALLKQVLEDDPPHPAFHDPAVPRDLVTICLKCLQKNPRKRYASAAEVADELKRFLESRPIRARPAGLVERSLKWARRRPAVLAIASLLVVLVVVTVELRLDYERRLEKTADEAVKSAKILEHRLYAYRLTAAYVSACQFEFSPARRTLESYLPAADEEDLRGFAWYLVWRLTHLELSTQRLPPSKSHWVRFTPDGRRVAVSCFDGIHLQDVAEPGRPESIIPKLEAGDPAVLDFSADGRWIVFADEYHRKAVVEELDTGSRLPEVRARFVDWSPSLEGVVALDEDGKLSLLEVPSMQGRGPFETRRPLPGGFAVSREGREMAIVSAGGALTVWDLATGSEQPADSLALRAVHDECSAWLAFSPDAKLLACAHPDSRVTLWERAASKPRWTGLGHAGKVLCVAFSPDGRWLATGGDDRTIRIWNVETGDELAQLLGHQGRVSALAFDPTGERLASTTTMDHTLKLWDVSRVHASYSRPAKQLLLTDYVIRTLVCTPDEETVIVGEVYDTMHILDLEPDTRNGVSARPLETLRSGGSYSHGASSPDGRRVVAIRDDGEVSILNVERNGEVVALNAVDSPGPHPGKVEALGLSPDGTALGTMDRDGRLFIWRRPEGGAGFRLEKRISAAGCGGIDLVFSTDNRYLAVSCRSEADVFLCDLERDYECVTFPGSEEPGALGAIAFSPDSRLLATGGRDAVVTIWDAGGRPAGAPPAALVRCTGHVGGIYSLAFTPDGRRLASGSADLTIKIWDMSVLPAEGSAFECLTLRGHEGQVTALAFTPDGRTLLSGGDLQAGGEFRAEVRAWRAATDEEVLRYQRR